METKQRTYSEPQLRYMATKAAFIAVDKTVNVTDDLWCAAAQAQAEARNELLAWAYGIVSSDPKTAARFAANKADLDRLFDAARMVPTIRGKVTDACLRLSA